MSEEEKAMHDKWLQFLEQAEDEDYLEEQARRDEEKRQTNRRQRNKQWVGFEQ